MIGKPINNIFLSKTSTSSNLIISKFDEKKFEQSFTW